jgi:hypothetical protein
MPMGEDTIGLRTLQPGGRDRWNNEVTDPVDQLVRLCLVTPTRSTEDESGRAARVAGASLLAPPTDEYGVRLPLASDSVVLWPVTSVTRDGDGVLHLDGALWQVDGDVGNWGDCLEAQLTRSGGA